MNIKDILKRAIKKSLDNNNIQYDKEIFIDIPKDTQFGDYSCNIAMQLCKVLGKNPLVIAELIKRNIVCDNINDIKVENPGFINFYLKKDYLYNNINNIIEKDDKYGKSNYGQGEKINIEYVSVNPTGLIHVGHARGAAFGDSLTRIMTFSGYDVTREYYINDAGNQIDNLAESTKERYKEICGKPFYLGENHYHGEEIKKLAQDIYNKYNDTKLEEEIEYFKDLGLKEFLDIIKTDLKDFGVSFDVWTSEKQLYKKRLPIKTLELLKEENYTYEKDNATWIKTTMYGDDKDRVLVKSDGNSTYLLPDIAYHNDKISRGYHKLIDILGADHHGYIARLKASVAMLGKDPNILEVHLVQMVRLIKDNEEYKMSKRTGKTITLRDLIQEIGKDALRYFFASKSLDTQMDFDVNLALSTSNDNPVYYVQYAHARICSILREANSKNLKLANNFETINSQEAYNVLAKLYEFEDIINKSAEKRQVHLVTNYVYELATLFHTLYAKEKILSDDIKKTSERLSLIKAVQITIKNALTLIGVEAKERM